MLVIDDLDGATVECAGALVAREHAAARQVRPELPAGFDSAEVCAAARTPAPVLPGDPTWTSRDGSMSCTARSGELLDQNGDVPRLAGQALAATARSFVDIAELDFCRPSQKQAEIDIIALADGR
jgi:hypothetical protein